GLAAPGIGGPSGGSRPPLAGRETPCWPLVRPARGGYPETRRPFRCRFRLCASSPGLDMAQAPTKADPKNAADKGQQPPDERCWVRYSPHHEFPLSLVISVCLHIGGALLLIFAAIWWVSSADSPAAPPRMDLAEIEGGDPLLDGLGVGDTLKGSGPKNLKAENVGESRGDRPRPRPEDVKIAELKGPREGPKLKFPDNPDVPPDEGETDPFAGLD